MKVLILKANEPTPAGHIYDEVCLKNIMDQYWDRKDSFYVTMNNDTPPISLTRIAGQVTNMYIEDNALYAEIKPILDLPGKNGETLEELHNIDAISYGISAKAHCIENKVDASTLQVSHISINPK